MAKQYTKDFKEQACKLVIHEEIPVKVVAEKLGVDKILLYQWITKYNTYGDEAFVGQGHLRKEDAKYSKLLKENERLKMENEILKKAAAYFAREKGKE